MRATLILRGARHNNPRERRHVLRLDTEDSRSRYGLGVLKYGRGRVIDGFNFRWLRDTEGALIITSDRVAVCRAMGVPESEAGIIETPNERG